MLPFAGFPKLVKVKKRDTHIHKKEFAQLPQVRQVRITKMPGGVEWAPVVLLDPEAKTVSMEATVENVNMLFVLVRAELEEFPRTETSSSVSARRSLPAQEEVQVKRKDGHQVFFVKSKGCVECVKADAIKTQTTPRTATLNQRRRQFIKVTPKRRRNTEKLYWRLRPNLRVQRMCLTTWQVWACHLIEG